MNVDENGYELMVPDVKAEWVERLRAQAVRPNRNWLYSVRLGVPEQSALGVLCEIAHEHGQCPKTYGKPDDLGTVRAYYGAWPQINMLPDEVLDWANLRSRGRKVEGVRLDWFRQGQPYNLFNLCKADARWSELADVIEVQL